MRKSLLRASDQVFRYGGEEFCVILPDATEESAMAVAERLRTAVQDVCTPHASSPVAEVVTISIGVALRQPREGITNTELVELADKAQYAAKTRCRNRVCMADAPHTCSPAPEAGIFF